MWSHHRRWSRAVNGDPASKVETRARARAEHAFLFIGNNFSVEISRRYNESFISKRLEAERWGRNENVERISKGFILLLPRRMELCPYSTSRY